MRVLSRLFRRLFLEGRRKAFTAGRLSFFGGLRPAGSTPPFTQRSRRCAVRVGRLRQATVRRTEGQVLAYLARYTHRVAISNTRLIGHRRWQRHASAGRSYGEVDSDQRSGRVRLRTTHSGDDHADRS